MSNQFYRLYGKRMFDLTLSVTALAVLSPVLAVTAILIRIFLGAPVLFRQERPGFRSRVFQICKFRSMTDARDSNGELLDDALRHTAFGRFLRSSSIDELPELWNVAKGQMSLVGPRPLRTHFLPFYSREQARRHDVTPGITGWAQVNGRNQLSWEDRFACDVWYVDNMSFWLDLKILWMTVIAVFSRDAIDAEDGGEFPDFTGTKEVIDNRSTEEESTVLPISSYGGELQQLPVTDHSKSENALLALEGGTPVRTGPLSPWPSFDEELVEAAANVLRSNKVNYWTGEECKLFEQEYAAAIGVRHAIALTNGTVALELALYGLGIGPGDEVIVPSRTFIASASCTVMRGATPVVADVDSESQTLTVETIRSVITPRTKAIVAVHLAGWPCDLDPILELAHQHGIKVIEDCAQAHHAMYKGRHVGSIGDVGAFSFCQDKKR
jgi:lipopolysaccharide/colanic/teichoic acid biosynthesis glycosyltransferase